MNNIGKALGPNLSNRERILLTILASISMLALVVLGFGILAGSPSAPASASSGMAALVAAPVAIVSQPVTADYNDCESEDWAVVFYAAPAEADVQPARHPVSARECGTAGSKPLVALQILDIPPPLS